MRVTRAAGAWLGLFGGLFWAAKALYDWLGLERQVHRGYPPSDATDYIEFIVPLLCIGTMAAVAKRYGAAAGVMPLVVSIGLGLTAAFHASETYLLHSSIPFGLVFFLTGHLILLAGTIVLAVRIGRAEDGRRPFSRCLYILFAAILALCLSPAIKDSLPGEAVTGITVSLMTTIGILWAALGAALIADGARRPDSNPEETKRFSL